MTRQMIGWVCVWNCPSCGRRCAGMSDADLEFMVEFHEFMVHHIPYAVSA